MREDQVGFGGGEQHRQAEQRETLHSGIVYHYNVTMTAVTTLDAAGARLFAAERLGLPVTEVNTTPLAGGISNDVVLVETPSQRFVLKQALGQLRVKEDWFSDRDRIFREAAVLQRLEPLLPPGSVPQVLFVDRDHFCYAMTAAPAGSAMWKTSLMRGDVRARVAANIGRLHGELLRVSWNNDELAREFGDQTPFEQLRLQPYYEFTAQRNAEFQRQFEAAQTRCRTQRVSLVHGDWSPKNMMVSEDGSVMVIDFEVIHYGDPEFDIAFLLNHLMLKSLYRPDSARAYHEAARQYWQALAESVPGQAGYLEEGSLRQLPLLMLARLDGKSPAEYIKGEALRTNVRQLAEALLRNPPESMTELWTRMPQ